MPRRSKASTGAASTVTDLAGSLGDWYLALHPNYTYVPFQQERLIPALERHARREGDKRKLMVQVHPGCAKTEIGTIALASWYMGNNPGHNVFCLSYGEDLANEFGTKIRDVCASPLAQSVFPGLKLKVANRSNKHFETEQGNNFYSAGFAGTFAGRRIDLGLIDDPVKEMEEAASEAEMRHRFNIYRSNMDGRMRPGGIIVANLTRYGLRDFAGRALQHEGDEWDQLILDAENPDGSYLWEEYFGRAKYEAIKRKDPQVWWAVWRQQPQAFTENYFDEDWWQTYDPKIRRKEWRTYMICDPALRQGRTANKTSIIVLAAGPERRLFVVDWVYDRMDPDQRADAIVRLVRKWRPKSFIYEEFGFVADTFYLSKRFAQEKISIRPISVGRRGPRSQLSKDQRIRELISDFREGRILFPPTLRYRQVNGEVIDIIEVVKNEEYLPYRGADSVPCDDGLDSLSRIHEPELNIRYVQTPDATPDRPKRFLQSASWEAVW